MGSGGGPRAYGVSMVAAKPLPDSPKTMAQALAALQLATRLRHAAAFGSPEMRSAEAEELRLTKLIWRMARD